MKKKIRPLGDILLDLEVILDEMILDHDLQFGDILGLTLQFLEIHHPKAKEVYEDNTSPYYFYGPKEGLK